METFMRENLKKEKSMEKENVIMDF